MEKLWKTKPVEIAPFSRSPVDIIVPFHGQIEKVARLVNSILWLTRSNPYQICLVDDASHDKTFIDSMKSVPQVFTVKLEKQVGFGAALEAGFLATKQPWVIFMHSDCVVEHPGWMINMGRSLLNLKPKNVRMVSAMSNNPGVEEEVLKSEPGESREDRVLDDGFLPFYCVMMHRELFRHTGGFIKKYPYVGYEDEEFAYRMRRYGFKQAVCGSSWVRHDGGATINAILEVKPNLGKAIEENRQRCLADIKKLRGV